ncbi:hypothetical protein Tco_0686754 [Tanacetum coccineum]
MLKDTYNNENLTTFKPYHITISSFKTPSASEVPLTSHMLEVAKISKDRYKSLILSSGEANVDDSANKSVSITNVQPVTQSKATTNKKARNKRNTASSKPKTLKDVRESSLTPQVADT